MKNLFTNLMKNTAKSSQNTGGGASRHEALIIAEQFSQSQTSRSEGARQITARFESAQMKNTSLISGCSAVDVPMPSYGAPDEHPMSIRSASDERRWNSRGWKYVACMLLVLFVGVGNVWGAEYTLINQSTGAINNTDFCVNASASSTAYTVEETPFSKCISLGGAYTSPVGAYPETKIIRYDVKTNDVTITVYAYNKATSKYSVYVSMLEEGATTAVVRETSWTGKSGKVITERFTPTKNASIYVHVGNNSNLVICQVSASENGSNLPSVASNGYSIRLDSCRATTTVGETEYLIDGALKIKNANNGARIWNKSYPIKLKSTSDYISFITTSTMIVSIKASGTYSVTKSNTYQSGSAISGNREVELTSGTWYICPNGSNTSFTTLSFASAAPSCEDAPTVSSITKGATTATTQVMNCAGISSLGSEGCTISSYGFVYGTSANPTISDTKVQVGTTYTTTGTAFTTTTLTGLTPSTTYYVRAYATNGAGTAYSSGDSFTTPASIGNVVYIAGSADASNDAIKALRDANYVVTVRTKAASPDYTGVDLVVLDESLSWVSSSDEVGTVIAADVPILNLKSFFYKSDRWNWGTPVNPSPKSELATLSTEYSNVSSHPIFDGVTISEGAVDMIGTSTAGGNNLQGVTTSTLVSGKEGYTLATSADGTTCIHELTPAQRGVTNSKYLLIALSNDVKDKYSADAKKMIVNAAAYLIDNSEQWEPAAPSCAATAEAGADKSTTVGEGVAMAATAAGEGYTGAWSIKAGSPSTDAGQLGTTSSNTMTFTPASVGTYTLIWTVTDDSNGSCYATDEAAVTVSKADMPSTGLAVGEATSITASGATLPFTMTSTTGVGSLTIKVYDDNDDVVKIVTNITPAKSGSQAVTGLSASTTYYYTITPIGDANHNDGDETSASSTFTTLTVSYSVTYAGDSPTTGTAPTNNTNYTGDGTETVTVAGANSMTKTGYTFRGWSDGTTFFLPGQTFTMPASNVTLTAVWDGNGSSVTLTHFGKQFRTSAPRRGFAYAGSLSGTKYIIESDDSNTKNADNDSSAIRLNYNGKYLKVLGPGATTTLSDSLFTGVTQVSFKWQYIASNTTYTTGIDVYVGSTKVDTKSLTGNKKDDYATATISNIASKNGTVKLVNTGTTSSDQKFNFDDITITCGVLPTGKTVTFACGSTEPSTSVSGMPGKIEGITSGLKIVKPADPSASGYIFDGWYSDAACTSSFIFSGTITKDTTIYAKWTSKTQPTQYTVGGDTYYCPGETATITLSGSQSGASYQLKKGGSAQGDPKAGTGDALSWTGLTAGTYTISAVETATYAARDMSGSVTVDAAATTAISTQPTTSVSAGTSVNFTLGSDMVTAGHGLGYQWYSYSSSGGADEAAVEGAESATYTTSKSAGTYYYKVKVSGDCGDPVYSNMITVTVKTAPTVYELSGSAASICDEVTLTLDGSDDGVSYQLYKSGDAEGDPKAGDGEKIEWTVTSAGTYTVKTVETSTYAEATMKGTIVIEAMTATSITTQPAPSPTGHDGVNFTLGSDLDATGEGTLTYQWYSYSNSSGDNETTVGSATTTKTLTTSKSAGTYYYKVKVIGECGSVKSNMITVTVDNKHLLTYSANNGSGAPTGDYYAPSASVTLNSTTIPTRSGYVFLGWNTNSSGTGDMYQPGATYTMPETATTLYAAWGSPCFSFSKGTKGTEPTDGFVMTPENINSSAFNSGATLSGGNMTNTSGATLGINGSRGFVMIKSTRELTLTLTGGQFQEGTVITLEGYTNNENSKSYGFALGTVKVGGTKSTESTGDYTPFSQRYVVVADDGIEGTSSVVVKMNGDCTGSQTYLSAIKIGGCFSCTSISPSLSYDKTTIWVGESVATPTLNKDGSTGAVTYASSNTDAATVDESSGEVTAVAHGTTTITATIAADGTHCGKSVSSVITVKDMTCEYVEIAGATRKASAAAVNTYAGALYKEAVFNTDNTGKISGGKYVYLVLKSGHYFQNGDTVAITITDKSDMGTKELNVCAGGKIPGTCVGVISSDKVVENAVNKVVLSNVPSNTDTITVHRAGNSTTQNPFVQAIAVYRYGCADVYYFNDESTSGAWSDEENWLGPAGQGGGLPTIDDRVVINKSITIDREEATAGELIITNGSTVTVEKSITVGDVSLNDGSTLNIAKDGDDGITVATNSLYLKGGWNDTYSTYDMPRVYINPASTLTKTITTVNYDISVDARNYYPFAVPFRVKVKDVNYANSTLARFATYGPTGQYVIKEYDGARRAEVGPDQVNNWKVVPQEDNERNDVYLEPGRGYIMTAVSIPAYGGGVIRFPLSFTNDWTAEGEQGTIDDLYYKNKVAVTAYSGAATGDKKVNKGWNLLGVPFMSCYATDVVDNKEAVIQGRYDFKTNTWIDGSIRYVNVPSHDFAEYIQTDITDPETVLRPGWCFFVQIDGSGNLTFETDGEAANSDLPIYAPKREQANMPEEKTGIILSGAEASDKTTFLVSDKYSASEYEINADLEKLFGNGYTLATYSLSGTTRLAYNALSNADAANLIPIGYRAPAEGEYTFSINPRYAENGAFKSVNLIDYETGVVTDLMMYSYTFFTDRTQNDSRFAINVEKQKDTPTDVENVQGDDVQNNKVRKLLLNGNVYIIRGAQMYDATGRRVEKINK